MLIAKEKKNYHNILIESVLERYKDAEQRKKLIESRMEEGESYITLHMSLKRTLRKNKEMKRIKQMQQRRGDGQEEEETKVTQDPPLDVMKLKTQAVLN